MSVSEALRSSGSWAGVQPKSLAEKRSRRSSAAYRTAAWS
jgi:hypothetical protein